MKNILLISVLFLAGNLFSQNYIKYYPNGCVKETGTFIDSTYKGDVTRYYQNGQVSFKGHYSQSGKEEGVIQYFYQNGKKEFEYIAINGKPVGEGYTYFETGELKKVTYFDVYISKSENTNKSCYENN